MFLGVIVLSAIIMVCFGYIKYIQTNTLTWSEIFLGALSNLISPCVIQHQTSGMIAYFSSFVIMKLTFLMTVFLTILHADPLIWNSSSDFKGTEFEFLSASNNTILIVWKISFELVENLIEKYHILAIIKHTYKSKCLWCE